MTQDLKDKIAMLTAETQELLKQQAAAEVEAATHKAPKRKRLGVAWMRDNAKIVDSNGDLVPFTMWKEQRYLYAIYTQLRIYNLARRFVTGKTRKRGMTTFGMVVGYKEAREQEYRQILLVAHDKPTMQSDYEMAAVIHRNLPNAVAQELPLKSTNPNKYDMEFRHPHGSKIGGRTSGAENPGRGFTPQFLLVDELAFWDNAMKKWSAVFSALPKQHTSRDTTALAFSTANGPGDVYHKLYTESVQAEKLVRTCNGNPQVARDGPSAMDRILLWSVGKQGAEHSRRSEMFYTSDRR